MKWKGKYRIEQDKMRREERDQRTVDHNEEYLLRRDDGSSNKRGK